MCFKVTLLTLVCLGVGLAAQKLQEKRQVSSITSKEDHVPAETGFGSPAAAVQTGNKFFQDIYVAMEKPNELEFGHVRETPHDWEQRFEKINLKNLKRQGKVPAFIFHTITPGYIHNPSEDHVDHGHKRGNDHHFIERHEKERPHAGEFKTKVRWGDKHGGYGEHYWDYNHAGHDHDGDGGESQVNEEYAAYEDESKNVPVLTHPRSAQREKREPELLKDVEFISDRAKSSILDGNVQKHGGNYKRANDYRGKREQQKNFGKALVFDSDLGVIVDEDSGIQYNLNPIPK